MNLQTIAERLNASRKAMEMLEMKPNSFYRRVKEYEERKQGQA
jgi:hypothetical protein